MSTRARVLQIALLVLALVAGIYIDNSQTLTLHLSSSTCLSFWVWVVMLGAAWSLYRVFVRTNRASQLAQLARVAATQANTEATQANTKATQANNLADVVISRLSPVFGYFLWGCLIYCLAIMAGVDHLEVCNIYQQHLRADRDATLPGLETEARELDVPSFGGAFVIKSRDPWGRPDQQQQEILRSNLAIEFQQKKDALDMVLEARQKKAADECDRLKLAAQAEAERIKEKAKNTAEDMILEATGQMANLVARRDALRRTPVGSTKPADVELKGLPILMQDGRKPCASVLDAVYDTKMATIHLRRGPGQTDSFGILGYEMIKSPDESYYYKDRSVLVAVKTDTQKGKAAGLTIVKVMFGRDSKLYIFLAKDQHRPALKGGTLELFNTGPWQPTSPPTSGSP